MDDIRQAARNAKVLNGERVRFEVAGGKYRLIVAFDFGGQIAFVNSVAPTPITSASMH
jgi:mRNA interferase HigB